MRTEESEAQAQEYVQAVAALRVSEWTASGIPEVLDAAAWAVRMSVCWLSLRTVGTVLWTWTEEEHWNGEGHSSWNLICGAAHLCFTTTGALAVLK